MTTATTTENVCTCETPRWQGIHEATVTSDVDGSGYGAEWSGTSDVVWDSTRLIGFGCEACGGWADDETAAGMAVSLADTLEPVRDLAELQASIGAWGDATFPRADRMAALDGVMAHLEDEVAELWDEIGKHDVLEGDGREVIVHPRPEKLREELADVFILACQAAHLLGIDAAAAITEKMAENRKRRWGRPDARGVVKHIETGETA